MGSRKTFRPRDIRETAGLRLARAHSSKEDVQQASAAYYALLRFPPLTDAREAEIHVRLGSAGPGRILVDSALEFHGTGRILVDSALEFHGGRIERKP